MEKTRIQKLIAQSGYCSRRMAEKLITDKRVKINNTITTLGDQASPEDQIYIDNKLLSSKQDKVYYLVNKPKKVICTLKDNFDRRIITDLLKDQPYRVFPVGRLDYDTTGAIILTNDGELANKLMHPSNKIIRVYQVITNRYLTKAQLDHLNNDKIIINGQESFHKVICIDDYIYQVELHQGSYHHIKYLFEEIDVRVKDLKRLSYASLNVDNLVLGQFRKLKKGEVEKLQELVNQVH